MGCGGSKADTASEPNNQETAATHGNEANASPTLDARLPFSNYREFFTLKNYFKSIRRAEADCAKNMLAE